MMKIIKRSVLPLKKLHRSFNDVAFELATEDRYDEIFDHLHSVSYRDVPLYKAAGFTKDGNSALKELDEYYHHSLKEGVSVLALDKGKLVGVMINGIITPDTMREATNATKNLKIEEYKKMDYMYLHLLLKTDIFNRFGIDKALECRLLSTTRERRKLGLAKTLVDKLVDIAREQDIPLVVTEIANDFLWKSSKAQEWTLLSELLYSDFIDEATGKPLFQVDPPNNVLRVVGKIIDNKCKSKDPFPLPRIKMVYPKVIN